jgi:hypothetical protein
MLQLTIPEDEVSMEKASFFRKKPVFFGKSQSFPEKAGHLNQ